MVTKEQVQALRAAGCSYEEIGAELGIPPGQAHLIGTGRPADGSEPHGEPTQHLANPPAHNPTRSDEVEAWARDRAITDPRMQQAARSADEDD